MGSCDKARFPEFQTLAMLCLQRTLPALRQRLSLKTPRPADVTSAHIHGFRTRRKQATFEEFLIEQTMTDAQLDAFRTHSGPPSRHKSTRHKSRRTLVHAPEESQRPEGAKQTDPDRTLYTFRTMDLWDGVGNATDSRGVFILRQLSLCSGTWRSPCGSEGSQL